MSAVVRRGFTDRGSLGESLGSIRTQPAVAVAPTPSSDGPQGAALLAAALAALPAMTPKLLRSLLRVATPGTLWAHIQQVAAPALEHIPAPARRRLVDGWAASIERVCLESVRRHYARAGVAVLMPEDPAFPLGLRDATALPDRCELLFVRGDSTVVRGRRVLAIVGTRRASPYGLRVARDLAAQAAGAGMVVASGLALGIDGAAHEGALSAASAPVIGIVGSGLDVPYPKAHAPLARAVAARGVLMTESPLGGAPRAENFPDRNRLLVNLATVVLVVESPASGGSLITARLAAARGNTVLVVPGSVYSPTSSGTNALLNDALPCRDLQDIEVAMGWALAAPLPSPASVVFDAKATRVLDALGSDSVTVDDLAGRTSFALGELTLVLAELELGGAVSRSGGRWARMRR